MSAVAPPAGTSARSGGELVDAPPPNRQGSAIGDTLGWREFVPTAEGRPPHPRSYPKSSWRDSYPAWAYDRVRGTDLERAYDLTSAVNPFVAYGDFDGDGLMDIAAWTRRRSGTGSPDSPMLSLVVVHRAGGVHHVETPYFAPTLWGLHTEEDVRQEAAADAWLDPVDLEAEEELGGPPPTPTGHAIRIEQPDGSGSSLVYWDGEAYRTYWSGC